MLGRLHRARGRQAAHFRSPETIVRSHFDVPASHSVTNRHVGTTCLGFLLRRGPSMTLSLWYGRISHIVERFGRVTIIWKLSEHKIWRFLRKEKERRIYWAYFIFCFYLCLMGYLILELSSKMTDNLESFLEILWMLSKSKWFLVNSTNKSFRILSYIINIIFLSVLMSLMKILRINRR